MNFPVTVTIHRSIQKLTLTGKGGLDMGNSAAISRAPQGLTYSDKEWSQLFLSPQNYSE